METALFYIAPFFKNLTVLYLTASLLMLGRAIKSAGVSGFSFKLWLDENTQRFIVGFVFIFGLSLLMAITDVAPLFQVFGFDINASPVGLGIALGGMLMLSPSHKPETKKASKAKAIAKDANAIIKKSSEIVEAEEGK